MSSHDTDILMSSCAFVKEKKGPCIANRAIQQTMVSIFFIPIAMEMSPHELGLATHSILELSCILYRAYSTHHHGADETAVVLPTGIQSDLIIPLGSETALPKPQKSSLERARYYHHSARVFPNPEHSAAVESSHRTLSPSRR